MFGQEMKDKREIFIEKAKDVHKGENIDYSKVVYINNRTKVCLIDHDLKPDGTEYGEFWQTPYNHLRGQSHPLKKGNKISKNKSAKQDEVIRRFKEVHKDENMDYSQVVYKNMHTKVKIICHDLRPDGTEYGEFWQEPVVHLKGCSHPDKANDRNHLLQTSNTKDFLEKLLKRFPYYNERYDFSEFEYVNNRIKGIVICKKHGKFSASPSNLLKGKGCPSCGNHLSKGQNDIYDFIKDELGFSDTIKNCKTELKGAYEIDVYVPSMKFGIEYNGLRWHSELFKEDDYHLDKLNYSINSGIRLINIFEDEWLFKSDIVKSRIKSLLGKSENKVYARKCKVKDITYHESEVFLNNTHIQGNAISKYHYGLFYNNELVAVMTFCKLRKNLNRNNEENVYELLRYSSKLNTNVIGGAGKLFKHFIKTIKPLKIISYADKRWSNGNLYEKLGFTHIRDSKPNYYYIVNGKRENRFSYRKDVLVKEGYDKAKTEHQIMLDRHIYRIYDCGCMVYEYDLTNNGHN